MSPPEGTDALLYEVVLYVRIRYTRGIAMAGSRHVAKTEVPERKRVQEPLVSGLSKPLPVLQKDVLRYLPMGARLELGRAIEKSLEGNPDAQEARMIILEPMLGREHLEQMADIKTEMEGMCRYLENAAAGVTPMLRLLRLQGGIAAYLCHSALIDSIASLEKHRGRLLLLRYGLMGNAVHTNEDIGAMMGITPDASKGRIDSARLMAVREFPEFGSSKSTSGFYGPFYPSYLVKTPFDLRDHGFDTVFDAVVEPSLRRSFDYLAESACKEVLGNTSFGIVDGHFAYYRQGMSPQELLATVMDLHISSHPHMSIDDVIKLEQAGITAFRDLVALSAADLKGMGFTGLERRRISNIQGYGISLANDLHEEELQQVWRRAISEATERANRIPHRSLFLPWPAEEALNNAGITTLGDIVAAGREKVSALKGIGKKTMLQLESGLKHHGLSFDSSYSFFEK